MNVLSSITECALSHYWTVAVAESCSGGRIASLLTSRPGASAWFAGGVVAYQNKVKSSLLSVPKSMIDAEGSVSKHVAIAMAHGVMKSLDVDVALSSTGVAGPGPNPDGVEEGTVWLAVASRLRPYEAWRCQCDGATRSAIIDDLAQQALQKLNAYMAKMPLA